MATIQVILQGARIATYDIHDFPIVLQFGDQRTYNAAYWFIPAFNMRVPANRLSEIRTQHETFNVIVDGPEGFRCGPFPVTWVRNYYPRGKDCAFVVVTSDHKTLSGVSLSIVEGSLVVDPLGGSTPAAAGP